MRINVYSQEVTDEVSLVAKDGTDDTGQSATFHGVRIMLHSPEGLHHTADDDDRSAVTFWLPKSAERRRRLSEALHAMALLVEGVTSS